MNTPSKQKKAETVMAELVELMRVLKPSASDAKLQEYAHALQLTNGFASIANLPWCQEKGGLRAKRELQAISSQATLLSERLNTLPAEALRALEAVEIPGHLHPRMLWDELAILAKAAELASKCVPQTTCKKGRSVDAQARQVTNLTCKIFQALAGKPAKRVTEHYSGPSNSGSPSGPAYDFLAKVFSILGIAASADGQLKLYSRRQNKSQS